MTNALVCISAAPERFAQVEIRNNDDFAEVLGHYTCPATQIVYQMSLDLDEYDYKRVILAGGSTEFLERIAEKIRTQFPDAEVEL